MTPIYRGRIAIPAILVMLVAVGGAVFLLWQDMLRRQEQGRAELLIQVRRVPVALMMFDLAHKLGMKGDPVAERYSRGMTFVRRSDPIAEYTIVYETDQSSQSIRTAFGRIEGCEARGGGGTSLDDRTGYKVTRKDGERSRFRNDDAYFCRIGGNPISVVLWFVSERPDTDEYLVRDRDGNWQTPSKTIVMIDGSWLNSEYEVP